ncbi:RhoGAP-domain-containing protein [Cubamyces sp. BRFM 1775]|nr:RhoGAP-domain-containing protein [Cubamyces sp. BRFM 1775]
MPSSQSRTTDTHALSSSVPTSLSSSSLSSSFSSSRASSDLLPAASLSNSSQSDIITSDRSVSSLSSSSKPRFFPLVLSSAPPRSASLASMGHGQSRQAAASTTPPLSPVPSVSSSSTGGRLKRAWAGRRKKSEDITALLSSTQRLEKGRTSEHDAAPPPPPSSMRDLNEPRLERPPSRGAGGPKLLSLQSVFGGRKAAQQTKSGKSSSPIPPPPPPKPSSVGQRTPSSPPSAPAKDAQFPPAASASRPPLSTRSPPPHEPKACTDSRDHAASGSSEKNTGAQEKENAKEDWRKSDSTMASHSTIRPGALSGNRSPRPVSLAESSHSANTIVPPVNKRLSALITDAEFTMFEEADNNAADDSSARPPLSGRPSPTSSLKARNRRSASLNLGPLRKQSHQDSSGRAAGPHSPGRIISVADSSSRDTPTLTRAAAAGIIAPVSAGTPAQSTGNNIRGRLAAWTAASTSPPPREERPLPAPPPPQPRRQPGSPHPPPVNPTFRQTAVSMTGSLAPAAGFAMGFGKRAVEKVGRAWGGLSSNASNHSGYSSSSSVGGISTTSVKVSDNTSGYASSPQSGPTGWKARRKAPHGFSGGSSISSFASTSSEDHYRPTGPQLGRRLRGAKQSNSGRGPATGLVFRRDLQACVRDTAIDDVQIRMARGIQSDDPTNVFKPLEARLVPALVVRCAQHILRWGVQEEGLFRVSGRSSHVQKLRTEFDAGCDYDLTECEPGDLDPHAVASIFKTFLRELPEPILTTALLSYFESAVSDDQNGGETEGGSSQQPTPSASHGSVPGLGLRKPPSLSTLAMPSFVGMPSLSDAQVTALAFLISRLPQENRDLLFTVVELIKVTAARSKDTKMPLGNLLLVFCPSLNMSPTLLRVLCTSEAIWNGPPEVVQESPPPSDIPAVEREEEPGNAKAAAPAIDLRLPVVELDDIADSPQDDSPGDDAASFVSALEPCCSSVPTRSPSPAIYGAPIPPLSSSDSLDSSSFSDELASPEPPSCKVTGESKSALASANSLTIPETTDLSLPSTPRLVTDAAVPFPSTGGSVPPTPSPHAPLSHRKSYTLLSFPHLRSESSPDVLGNVQSGPKRQKRPSLHLLFTKKSSSSLPSASESANSSSAALNTNSGNLVISAPRPIVHVANSPPRLDMAISSSPIQLAFEEAASQMKGKDTVRSAPAMVASQSTLDAPSLTMRSNSGGSSIFSTPQSTPIADYYRGRTTSLFFPETSGDLSAHGRARSASQASESPSLNVDVAEAQQEDWMRSVLLAAQTGQASTSR